MAVIVEMESTEKNCLVIKVYEKWTSSKYKDPIDGEHEDATDSILAELKTGFSDTDSSLSSDSHQDCDNTTQSVLSD